MRSYLIVVLLSGLCLAQAHRFEISGVFSFTTSAQLYLNPKSSDQALRNSSVEMKGMTGQSIEAGYYISDNLKVAVSLSKEHGSITTASRYWLNNLYSYLDQEDGYNLYPIELSLFYIFPFSNEKFKFSMGGGLGYFTAEYFRNVGSASVKTSETKNDWGIQCSAWGEYFFLPNISAIIGMKFRDPSNEFKAEYKSQTFTYQGQAAYSLKKKYDVRINVDGIAFMGGVKYTFNFF